MLFSFPLFLYFRKSPNIPDIHYPEFFVALVYTSNMYSLYSITGNLLNSSLLKLIAFLMIFVALKQFSGFSKKRVLGYIVLSGLLTVIMMALLVMLVISVVYMTIPNQ